jgi:transposase
MPLLLIVYPHLTPAELVRRFQACRDAAERLRWQAVMLKSEGRSAKDIADICKKREDWVRRTVRAYNLRGPDALRDGRRGNGREAVLDEGLRNELAAALLGSSPDGGLWTGAKVAAWIKEKTGKTVDQRTGWVYLVKSGFTRQMPRPSHPEADKEAKEAFKKGGFRAVLISSFENIPEPRSRSGRRTKPGSD